MNQRGRQSAASLEVVNHSGIEEIKRPRPLDTLTSDEKLEWMRVVNDLPADWFRESNLQVLEGYCRTSVNCRRIADLIERLLEKEFDLGDYEKLLRMQEVQHRALLSFATKMRLTQQATYDKERKKNVKVAREPWSIDG
jgi:hypothetical protein